MDSPARSIVVKLTSGTESPERVSQAFTVAATAVASGVPVSLWLTGEASWLAVAGRAESFVLAHSAPLSGLRDSVLEGGRLTVCTQCAARRGLVEADLVPGAQIRGSATFVEEIIEPGAQALVY